MVIIRTFGSKARTVLATKVVPPSQVPFQRIRSFYRHDDFLRSQIRTCMHPAVSQSPDSNEAPSTTVEHSKVKKNNDVLVNEAVQLAKKWSSIEGESGLVGDLAGNEKAVNFIMKFTDWIMRAEDPKVAGRLLTRLIASDGIPSFFGTVDRLLMRVGNIFAPFFPGLVVGAARIRMMDFVSGFVGTVEGINLADGKKRNVNLLGEAVLGDREAEKRLEEAKALLQEPGVEYVSVKVSGVTSQLNKWDFKGSLDRVLESLRPLFRQAATSNPRVLINLDMEEYHDLEITIDAFTRLLEEPEFQDLDAGIVLQTYLPDALPNLQKLVKWAHERPGSGEIKVRLVKGANLAMEKVDAAMHGWNQAPYLTKSETDANYLRCLDWVLTPERTRRVRIGVASHNLFLLSYAHLLAEEREVSDRVGFEMLQGMTPAHTPVLAEEGNGMLLYTPICRKKDFDVAISYLFRRFEEASSDGNFLRSLPTLSSSESVLATEQNRFLEASKKKDSICIGPQREQQRPANESAMSSSGLKDIPVFMNEPDTDPCLQSNRKWAVDAMRFERFQHASRGKIDTLNELETVMDQARRGFQEWSNGKSSVERQQILFSIANALAKRRGDLINALVHEGSKTIAEADPEVSEAIDFANYYGAHATELPTNFTPFGVVAVAAPWNYPVAIAAGGALAAIASGNATLLKPSPATRRCAEIIAECAWEAGVPSNVLQVLQCPDGDISKAIMTKSDAVILTGASDTAKLFRSWKPDMRLFAETSGKNALVISPAADLDLAVADLVHSAFSHSGQKCSASSLAICIGDVYNSERFRRQLRDAVMSLKVGYPSDVATVIGPLSVDPEEKLIRALTNLDDGEEWLVKPRCLDSDGRKRLWTPGVRMGVKPGSWFHMNEVFGPVLGVMKAADLDDALSIQNATSYGLTGGIHSLDMLEIEKWTENAQVGNAYINRGITGAIVQRQSFGGWKSSVVGPGAKAGGPNYLAQFGTISDGSTNRDRKWLDDAISSDEKQWREHFATEHDPTGLFCESNVFRYRPLNKILIRKGPGANEFELERVKLAAERCGVSEIEISDCRIENAETFAKRMTKEDVSRVRVVGECEDPILEEAGKHNIHVAIAPVLANGRVELLHYLREQSISRTKHRFGNLVLG